MTIKFQNTNPTEQSILWYLQQYCEENPRNANNVKSVWIREYGKGLEGTKTAQKRLNGKTISRLENRLDKVIVDENFNFDDAEQTFVKGSKLVVGKVDKKRESYFNKLISYIKERIKGGKVEATPVVQAYSIMTPVLNKEYVQEELDSRRKKGKGSKKKVIKITSVDLLPRLRVKYSSKSDKELKLIVTEELNRLRQEFDSACEYLQKTRKEVTINNIQLNYFRLLGWKYLEDESLTIEDIHLDSIIPIVDTRIRNYMSFEYKYIQ